LLVYPFFAESSSACEEPQCLLIPVSVGISNLLPGFLRQWAQGVGAEPSVFLTSLGVLGVLLFWSRHLKHKIHDLMRAHWYLTLPSFFDDRAALKDLIASKNWLWGFKRGTPALLRAPPWIPDLHGFRRKRSRSFLRPVMRLRRRRSYQQFFQIIRWTVLPNVFGLSVLFLGAASVFAIGTAAAIRFDIRQKERNGIFCDVKSDAQPLVGSKKLPNEFETSSACWPTTVRVEKGAHYRVLMDVIEPWVEGGSIYTNPTGIDLSGIGWSKSIEVALFRRSMRARWFQPLIRISQFPRSEVQVLNMSFVAGHTFAGSFTAGLDGELFLFVNEIMVSKDGVTTDFYENNRGRAVVTIERFDT
jgi:hypothetical protein